MTSISAIWRLLCPRAISAATSCSRGLSRSPSQARRCGVGRMSLAADELAYLGFYTLGGVSPVIMARSWCLDGRPGRLQRQVGRRGRCLIVSGWVRPPICFPASFLRVEKRKFLIYRRECVDSSDEASTPAEMANQSTTIFDIAGNRLFPAMSARSAHRIRWLGLDHGEPARHWCSRGSVHGPSLCT